MVELGIAGDSWVCLWQSGPPNPCEPWYISLAPKEPTIWDTGALKGPSGPTMWVLGGLGYLEKLRSGKHGM